MPSPFTNRRKPQNRGQWRAEEVRTRHFGSPAELVSVAETRVGWVDGHRRAAVVGEPHQRSAKSPLVGLASLDPPYYSATFRNRNELVYSPSRSSAGVAPQAHPAVRA